MSGGFLGRAFGLGRLLLLRGFGGAGGAPPVTHRVPCLHMSGPVPVLGLAIGLPAGVVDLSVGPPVPSLGLTIGLPPAC